MRFQRAAETPAVAWAWGGVGFSIGLGGLTGRWGEPTGPVGYNTYLLSLHRTHFVGYSSLVFILGPLRLAVGWRVRR